jgi:hypothetical protein
MPYSRIPDGIHLHLFQLPFSLSSWQGSSKSKYKMLIESGVILQEPDGTRRVVSPEEAKEYVKSMPLERRKLYESIPEE